MVFEQMSFMLRRGFAQLAFLALSGLVATNAMAHPHSWIEMKTSIEGSDGHITGLKMAWSFDAMTSAYMLDGEDMSPDNAEQTLQQLASTVLDNMYGDHYFTYFYDGTTPIRYKPALNASLTRDRAKLVLHFELPLAKPQPLTADSLRLLVFEPSYYVDMTWNSQSDIELASALARQCQLEIVEPNPTPEQVSYAMSLPEDADPDNALGQLFTQTAKLRCVGTDR